MLWTHIWWQRISVFFFSSVDIWTGNSYKIMFPYFMSCLFSMLLATMLFHFALGPTLLLHVGLNHLTILSSHHHGGLLSSHFWSLRYHPTTTWVHLLSENFAMCLAQQNFCFQWSMILSFTCLCSRIILLWMCSHDIPSMEISLTLSCNLFSLFCSSSCFNCIWHHR